jgi:hypothetical protein
MCPLGFFDLPIFQVRENNENIITCRLKHARIIATGTYEHYYVEDSAKYLF